MIRGQCAFADPRNVGRLARTSVVYFQWATVKFARHVRRGRAGTREAVRGGRRWRPRDGTATRGLLVRHPRLILHCGFTRDHRPTRIATATAPRARFASEPLSMWMDRVGK